jgi:hypothetical protein
MNPLASLIGKLESYIPDSEALQPNVSGGTIGWHIAHSLLVINVVADAIASSKPEEYKWDFNWKRTYVLVAGKIPRGKIRAPEVVQVKSAVNETGLEVNAKAAKEKISALEHLQPNSFFIHPFLGNIKLKPAMRFLCIHTQHHLKIIEDIAVAAKSAVSQV